MACVENKPVSLSYNLIDNVPGSCITTAVCNVLGYSNQCFVFKEIEGFASKTPESYESMLLLFGYDTLEPLIAKKIEEEYEKTHNKNTGTHIYNFFLSDLASLMVAKKYDEALDKYQIMMGALRQYFCIEEVTQTIVEKSVIKIKLPLEKIAN